MLLSGLAFRKWLSVAKGWIPAFKNQQVTSGRCKWFDCVIAYPKETTVL